MTKFFTIFIFSITVAMIGITGAQAQGDVFVNGYYRSDGTYVRPHYRSARDGIKSNNYGSSKHSSELLNPRARDYDKDGIPNYLDMDSDNDGLPDNLDSNPYKR